MVWNMVYDNVRKAVRSAILILRQSVYQFIGTQHDPRNGVRY